MLSRTAPEMGDVAGVEVVAVAEMVEEQRGDKYKRSPKMVDLKEEGQKFKTPCTARLELMVTVVGGAV